MRSGSMLALYKLFDPEIVDSTHQFYSGFPERYKDIEKVFFKSMLLSSLSGVVLRSGLSMTSWRPKVQKSVFCEIWSIEDSFP